MLTTKQIQQKRKELAGLKKAIAQQEKTLNLFKTRYNEIVKSCCDADCENDGSAHRPACSVHKL